MVGHELQCSEQCRQGRAAQQFSAITEPDASQRGRNVCQSDEFPYVARTYNDYEICREAPCYSSEQCHIPAHLHAQSHNEKSGHHYEK